jgi:putative transposase
MSTAFKWDGKALTLAKMEEPLQMVWSRPLPENAKPSSVTISKDTAGRYFVSLLVEEEIKPLDVTPTMVGLDL